MQATVHEFDPVSGGGSVLLDDGRRVPFDPDTFERSGLRLLRPGQRLTISLVDATTPAAGIAALGIVGI